MRTDRRLLLRGLARLAAVVVASGLVGAGVGVALAELSGDDTPGVSLSQESSSTAASASAATGTTGTAVYRVPRVEVLSAQLGASSQPGGRAPVAVRVRVTNRGNRPLRIQPPALVSEGDEVSLEESARGAAGALLRPIEPGARASGVLRFAPPAAVAERLAATPSARLRVANRTVSVTLQTSETGE